MVDIGHISSALLVLVLLVGCGGEAQQADDNPGSTDDGGQLGHELHIPVEPETQVSLSPIVDDVVDAGQDRATLELGAQYVDLALGDSYPAAVDVELAMIYAPSCGPLSGDIEITEVTGGADAVEVAPADAASIRLERRAAGESLVQVSGRFQPSEEQTEYPCWSGSAFEGKSELRFELELHVAVRKVDGIALDLPRRCAQADTPVFFTGDVLENVQVFAVDARGDAFTPANASSRRPVSLTLTAPTGASMNLLEEHAGLAALTLPEAEAVIEVAGDVGRAHHIEVVAPSRVTSVEMHFELPGLSTRPVALRTGDTYGEAGFTGVGDRIIPSLEAPAFVGDTPTCSAPPAEFFELQSSTPQVCTVEQRALRDYEFKVVSISGNSIGQSAHLLTDGTCALTLQSPALGSGEGVGAELEATFVNVDTLLSMD